MSKKKDEAGAGDTGGTGTTGDAGSGVTLEQIRDVVREEVPKIVDDLLGDNGDDTDAAGGVGGGDGGTGDSAGSPASNRAVEASVSSQVRDELERIKGHESLVGRVGAVEEKLVEKPPIKRSWISRALWGDDE